MRNRWWALLAFAALSLATGCRQSRSTAVAVPTQTPQPAGAVQPTAPPVSPTAGLAPACPPATGEGTVAPTVSIDSITFVVNGLEQVLRGGATLQALPGDEVMVRGVTICAGPFSGNGGEACVDIAPVDRGGQEILSAHQGSHLVPLTPGVISIAWTSEPWTVGEDWTQFSAVVNHWPTSDTEDPDCSGGRCERDDRLTIALSRPTPLPTASPKPAAHAYWSVEPLTADRSVMKVEVAGSYEQIGRALGEWYRDQGRLARPLTAGEQQTARTLLAFYRDVAPGIEEQLRGVYAAYDLRLDDLSHAIPVWDEEGIRILLPGLVEPHSCSVIATRPSMAPDGHARLARNHDWPTGLTDVFLVFTAPEQGYPSVVMTRGLPGLAASDGMNVAGLALGLASVSNVGYTWDDPALPSNVAYRLVLEQCATVDEAVALLRRIPVGFINPAPEQLISHILLADRSGASAVVEFLPEGIVVSQTLAPYQVMTNNYWAGPADQYKCPRYQTAVARLTDARGAVDADRLMAIMSSLRGSTQWTITYDLQELSLQLALPGDGFTQRHSLSLADFVARMDAQR